MATVLIIEDEIPLARAMELKLNKSGIESVAVFNGAEGLTELKKGGYKVVLLDIMMPGIDGWTVLHKIKEEAINVKVVITSNLSQEEDKKKALELGAVDYIVKSDASIASIVEKVKSFL